MKITTLKENPALLEKTLLLIEKNFHYKEGFFFAVDFAPLMSPANHEHNYILLNDNEVVGHIGVTLKKCEKKNLAFIGGIAIDETYQGQGLFKKLFEFVLSQYEKKVDALVLWSDLHSLYEKFGFFPLHGLIQTGEKSFSCPPLYTETRFDKLSEKEFKELQKLYENLKSNYAIIERSPKDWEILKAIKSTKLFIKKSSEGQVESYFCLGKGMDLTDIIHEYGWKNEEEKSKLLKALSPYKLWLPSSEKMNFPESFDLILALVKSTQGLPQERLFISGLDSI